MPPESPRHMIIRLPCRREDFPLGVSEWKSIRGISGRFSNRKGLPVRAKEIPRRCGMVLRSFGGMKCAGA